MIANFVSSDKVGNGKGSDRTAPHSPAQQSSRGSERRPSKIIIPLMLLCAAVLFLLLAGVLLVSITWTHRPDLSVLDILRELVREIGKHR